MTDLRARLAGVLKKLKKHYPNSGCSLLYRNPFELLVATVLSAQCTDERVNKTTPALFAAFPDAEAMSRAKLPQLEKLIRSTGFYKNKALSLKGLSSDIVQKHQGQVPKSLEELTALRGVGRKTANVVLGNAFGIPGITVDTHVGRISRRLGLTRQKDPVKVEFALMELADKKDWVILNHLLIDHGRAICLARKARCEQCFLSEDCPKIMS